MPCNTRAQLLSYFCGNKLSKTKHKTHVIYVPNTLNETGVELKLRGLHLFESNVLSKKEIMLHL